MKGLSQIAQLTIEEFVDIGTKMGLSGKELVEFVEKKERKE